MSIVIEILHFQRIFASFNNFKYDWIFVCYFNTEIKIIGGWYLQKSTTYDFFPVACGRVLVKISAKACQGLVWFGFVLFNDTWSQ